MIATIGVFDGVHKAHQLIIDRMKVVAGENDAETLVVTLWPHPRIVLNKDKESLRLINTLDEKVERFEKIGLDNLLVLPFDKFMANMDFKEFIQKILVNQLKISHLVIGYDHQFGKNRQGNFEKLQVLSQKLGFGLESVDAYMENGKKIGSTLIRNAIQEGNMDLAKKWLGYRFSLTGKVVDGDGIGRKIGFPTANIRVQDEMKIMPAQGVYAVMAKLDGEVFKGMMNVGYRPTVNNDTSKTVLEVNLFDFSKIIYGETITIEFVKRIRSEKKFSTIDDLAKQISKDKIEISKILERNIH